MGDIARAWCWERSPYSGSAFTIHLALADIANDTHGMELWVVNAKLAKKTRVSRQRVNEVLQQMVDDETLEVLERPRRGEHRPVRYRFLMPDRPVVFAWDEERVDQEAQAAIARMPRRRVVPGDTSEGVVPGDTRCRPRRHDVSSQATPGVVPGDTEPNRTEGNRTGTETPRAAAVDIFGDQAPGSAGQGGKEIEKDFAEWWLAYPRKVAKGAARPAYAKARRTATAAQLLDGLHRSTAQWKRERRAADKIPYPATWLNRQEWDDEEPAAVAPSLGLAERTREEWDEHARYVEALAGLDVDEAFPPTGPFDVPGAPPASGVPEEPWTPEMQERRNGGDVLSIARPAALAREALRRRREGLPPLVTEGGEVHTGPRAPRVARAGASAAPVSSPPSHPKEATP
jgi:hypothetical protein